MSNENPTLADIRQAECLDIEQIADIIDSIEELVFQYNLDKGHFIYVGPNSMEVGKIPRERAYQMNFFDDMLPLAHPDDRDKISETLNLMIANPGQLYTLEYRKRNEDGTYDCFRERARSKVDEKSGDLIITGVVRNVTEEKAQLHEINELQHRLNEPYK